jgi:hypothetical protein
MTLALYRENDEEIVIHREGEVLGILWADIDRRNLARVGRRAPDKVRLRLSFDFAEDVSVDRLEVYVDKYGREPEVPEKKAKT